MASAMLLFPQPFGRGYQDGIGQARPIFGGLAHQFCGPH
jgi:hypothetical protein